MHGRSGIHTSKAVSYTHLVLFKGGSYLDAIARVNTVVFDKTGTLTEGLFEVREVHVAPGVNSGELLGWGASAERTSIHPVSYTHLGSSYSFKECVTAH